MSLSCFDSAVPVKISKFSLTENWTKLKFGYSSSLKFDSWLNYLLTDWFVEMNNCIIIFEHVNFVNV